MPTPPELLYPTFPVEQPQNNQHTKVVTFAHIRSRGNNDYFASSDGDIYRVRKIMPRMNRSGYMVAHLRDADGRMHPKTIHSAIAEAFIGERPEGLVINHIDGDKTNNSADNLEYTTQSENTRHAFRIGLHRITKESKEQLAKARLLIKYKKKLSDQQIVDMIKMYIDGGTSMKAVGEKFGVTAPTVCLAVNSKRTYENFEHDLEIPSGGFTRRKLTDKQISEIAEMYSEGNMSHEKIAGIYDVSRALISIVLKRKRLQDGSLKITKANIS